MTGVYWDHGAEQADDKPDLSVSPEEAAIAIRKAAKRLNELTAAAVLKEGLTVETSLTEQSTVHGAVAIIHVKVSKPL